MRPCMIYNPGSFGHCLKFFLLSLLFIDKANDAVVVPLRFDHNSLIYSAVNYLSVHCESVVSVTIAFFLHLRLSSSRISLS